MPMTVSTACAVQPYYNTAIVMPDSLRGTCMMGKIVRGSLLFLCGIMLTGIILVAAVLLMEKGMKLEIICGETEDREGMLLFAERGESGNFVMAVPYLGGIWAFFHSRRGKTAAILYIVFFLAIWMRLRCWREKDRREEDRWAYLWGNA